tara:strand:- start:403 stop:594 length:192 start_codon:yes stop_codon:yes gene_type:complete
MRALGCMGGVFGGYLNLFNILSVPIRIVIGNIINHKANPYFSKFPKRDIIIDRVNIILGIRGI